MPLLDQVQTPMPPSPLLMPSPVAKPPLPPQDDSIIIHDSHINHEYNDNSFSVLNTLDKDDNNSVVDTDSDVNVHNAVCVNDSTNIHV